MRKYENANISQIVDEIRKQIGERGEIEVEKTMRSNMITISYENIIPLHFDFLENIQENRILISSCFLHHHYNITQNTNKHISYYVDKWIGLRDNSHHFGKLNIQKCTMRDVQLIDKIYDKVIEYRLFKSKITKMPNSDYSSFHYKYGKVRVYFLYDSTKAIHKIMINDMIITHGDQTRYATIESIIDFLFPIEFVRQRKLEILTE
jgi:hypothetical protein